MANFIDLPPADPAAARKREIVASMAMLQDSLETDVDMSDPEKGLVKECIDVHTAAKARLATQFDIVQVEQTGEHIWCEVRETMRRYHA